MHTLSLHDALPIYAKLALAIFLELDANGDEVLHLPEFLYTWGRWARTGKETKDRR